MPACVVTAQFAIRSLPTSKRLSRRRNSGINSKCVQQSIRRKGTEEAAISFHCGFTRTVVKAYLRHGEGASLPRDLLANCILAGWSHRVDDWILCQQTLGYQS